MRVYEGTDSTENHFKVISSVFTNYFYFELYLRGTGVPGLDLPLSVGVVTNGRRRSIITSNTLCKMFHESTYNMMNSESWWDSTSVSYLIIERKLQSVYFRVFTKPSSVSWLSRVSDQ